MAVAPGRSRTAVKPSLISRLCRFRWLRCKALLHEHAGQELPGGARDSPASWPPVHRLELATLEELLWDARMLQTRAEQPPLHALRQLDWRPASREEHHARLQRVQQQTRPKHAEEAPPADDPLREYATYGGADEERGLGLAQQPLAGSALTELLTQITAGPGLGVLQLSASSEHCRALSRHTPHELALVTVGLTLGVGANSEHLDRRSFLHVRQQHCHGDDSCWQTLPSVASWPAAPPAQVTVVGCLQDAVGVAVGGKLLRQPHVVWATPAWRLLREVERRDAALAKLLLQPQVSNH
jgi:hypothetical protein